MNKEFEEYFKETNLFISKENLSDILKSYNILDSKIRYIAHRILGIAYDINRWEIENDNIELQWDEYDNYIEYESFPIDFLTLNSYDELESAWQKILNERAELKRKEEEEKKKREKEELEKKEKALYEQLKAKFDSSK